MILKPWTFGEICFLIHKTKVRTSFGHSVHAAREDLISEVVSAGHWLLIREHHAGRSDEAVCISRCD